VPYGHGGRREGAGRPRGAVNHRSLPFGALTAGLARKYGEEALNTLVAIMRDTRAPAAAQLDAAREILNRGEGRPQPSNEPFKEPPPPSASPESPEQIVAEIKRRGLLPVLDLLGIDQLRRDIIAAGRRIRRSRNRTVRQAENESTKRRRTSSSKSHASSKSKSGRRENPGED
jgi:hypothetical protein